MYELSVFRLPLFDLLMPSSRLITDISFIDSAVRETDSNDSNESSLMISVWATGLYVPCLWNRLFTPEEKFSFG